MAISRVKTWAETDALTAADLNAEFDNVISNVNDPDQINDLSSNTTNFQATTDPGEVGTESLPTSLTEEIKRLRFAIKEMKGTNQWYETINQIITQPDDVPLNSIPLFGAQDGDSLNYSGLVVTPATVVTSSSSTTFTDTTVVDGTAWDLSAVLVGHVAVASGGSFGIISAVDDGTDTVTVADWIPSNPANGETVDIKKYSLKLPGNLDVTGDLTLNGALESTGNNDATLLINAPGTGDAKLRLQVNDTSANAWDIYNDNSANDNLMFKYNATEKFRYGLSNDKLIVASGGGVEADYFLPAADDASAPAANRLYKANVPKAWASITSSPAISADHNISSVSSGATGTYTVSFDTAMADTDYSVGAIVTGITPQYAKCTARSTTSFTISTRDALGSPQDGGFTVIVLGNQ